MNEPSVKSENELVAGKPCGAGWSSNTDCKPSGAGCKQPMLSRSSKTALHVSQFTATLTKVTFGSFLFTLYIAEQMWCWTLANAFANYTPIDSLFLMTYQIKFFTYAAVSLLLCLFVYSCHRISMSIFQSSVSLERPKELDLPKDKRVRVVACIAIALLFIPLVRAIIMPEIITGLVMTMFIVIALTINFALAAIGFYHSLSETKHWLTQIEESGQKAATQLEESGQKAATLSEKG